SAPTWSPPCEKCVLAYPTVLTNGYYTVAADYAILSCRPASSTPTRHRNTPTRHRNLLTASELAQTGRFRRWTSRGFPGIPFPAGLKPRHRERRQPGRETRTAQRPAGTLFVIEDDSRSAAS